MIKSKIVTPGEGGGSTGGGARTYVVWATDHTMTTEEVSNTLLSNYGQTEGITWTLPSADAGYDFIAQLGAIGTNNLTIQPQAADHIYIDGTKLSAGEPISCTSPHRGDNIWFWVMKESEGDFSWVGHIGSGVWAGARAIFWVIGGDSIDYPSTPLSRKMDLSGGAPGSWSLDISPPDRWYVGYAGILGGTIYNGAGYLITDGWHSQSKMRSFQPGTGAWSAEIELSVWSASCSFLGIGTKGYSCSNPATGGPTNKMCIYDKPLGSWAIATNVLSGLSRENINFVSKEVSSEEYGTFYTSGLYLTTATIFYTPSLDTVITKANFANTPTKRGASFRKSDAEGYGVGGWLSYPTPTSFDYTVKFTNFGAGSWSSETVCPVTYYGFNGGGSQGCSISGKGYLTGEAQDVTNSNACRQYYDEVWTSMTSYGAPSVTNKADASYSENPI